MPNHVVNHLSFAGKGASKVRAAIKGSKKENTLYIDFNKIIPMPETLNVSAGSLENDAERIIKQMPEKVIESKDPLLVLAWMKENVDQLLDVNPSTKIYILNYITYGYTSWYGWACDNWGTKWNAYEQSLDDKQQLTFQTAWSTPEPVIAKLSTMFPTVTFTVNYADEDLGSNCGTYSYLNGECIDRGWPEGEEAFEYACEQWGYDAEELRRENEEA